MARSPPGTHERLRPVHWLIVASHKETRAAGVAAPVIRGAAPVIQGTAPPTSHPRCSAAHWSRRAGRPELRFLRSLATLKDSSLLDDEVINAYMSALASESGGLAVAFSVFWLPVMWTMPRRDQRCQTLRRCGADSAKVWLMPLNKGGTHRALIVMLRAQQRIAYLDSLSWAPDSDVIGLTQQLLEDVEDGPQNWADWIVVLPSNVPRQTDSHSCGVHVCWHARAAAIGVASDAPLDVDDMRREIRRSILTVRLSAFILPFITNAVSTTKSMWW